VRCIPEEPDFGHGQIAEKVVWEALKNSLPDDAVLAHSVQVRDGVREFEIDLLVLWPGGRDCDHRGQGRQGKYCGRTVVPVEPFRKAPSQESSGAITGIRPRV
jgi:hypothetical protein